MTRTQSQVTEVPHWPCKFVDASTVSRASLQRLLRVWAGLTDDRRVGALACIRHWLPTRHGIESGSAESRLVRRVVQLALRDASLAVRWLALSISCKKEYRSPTVERRIRSGPRRHATRVERILWLAAEAVMSPGSRAVARLPGEMVAVGRRHPELVAEVWLHWLPPGLVAPSAALRALLWRALRLGGEPRASRCRIHVWRPATRYAIYVHRSIAATLLAREFPSEQDKLLDWLSKSHDAVPNGMVVWLATNCRRSPRRQALLEQVAATVTDDAVLYWAHLALSRPNPPADPPAKADPR